ncbi:MAG: hypothetical protein CV087_06920 [Candidatus Brocadia sp. WS118]|nr:MAG: hypothetical protein CV087_06920 [Candidatus Brocadia sp. WS118]
MVLSEITSKKINEYKQAQKKADGRLPKHQPRLPGFLRGVNILENSGHDLVTLEGNRICQLPETPDLYGGR